MISNERPIEQLLTWLITKTRGGNTRAQIIRTLKDNPKNTNQLSVKLRKSYKTISHHLLILEKHKIIVHIGDNYAITYFLSQPMETNYNVFEQIAVKSCDSRKKLLNA